MATRSDPTTDGIHPILVPRDIVNADSVFVVSWAVDEGQLVEVGAAVCDIETSKAVVTVEATQRGYLRRPAAVGAEVAIGGILAYLTSAPDAALPESVVPAAAVGTQLSAKARRKIAELGLDPSSFDGCGFVRERDVLALAARRQSATPTEDPRGPCRLEPLGPIQRRVARVMEESVAAIPAATLERTIDLGTIRERARRLSIATERVVTEVDLLVAAVARACAQAPRFNGFLARDYQLHVFDRVNVGVAVDVEGDLYVVVVRDAAAKTPTDIAKELRGLQYLAARRRLTVEHLSGGTITVTSMVGRGIQRFQPIPYPQQAAIIGLADSAPGGQLAALTLVFDHRVANGAQAAAFLGSIDAHLGET